MAQCTAPLDGHRSASAAAKCPACRYKSRYGGRYGGYGCNHSGGYSPSPSPPLTVLTILARAWVELGQGEMVQGHLNGLFYLSRSQGTRADPGDGRKAGSTPRRSRTLLVSRLGRPPGRCNEALRPPPGAQRLGVVRRKDIPLGSSFLREIGRGLAKSRVGIVLMTPAVLTRPPTGGVADRGLSALLATDQLVPIIHNTTYDALRMVSPLLASRNGLSTEVDTLEIVADKLAELVKTA